MTHENFESTGKPRSEEVLVSATHLTELDFDHFVEDASISVDCSVDVAGDNYRELIVEGKRADYEALV